MILIINPDNAKKSSIATKLTTAPYDIFKSSTSIDATMKFTNAQKATFINEINSVTTNTADNIEAAIK